MMSNKINYSSPAIALILGSLLIWVGFNLKKQQKIWIEQETQSVMIEGNRGKTAVVGGVTGAAVGAGAGVAIGGIGIAACGTGIGIPVGVVCLGLAALCGAAGAGIGAAAGKSAQTVEQIINVTHTGPAYSTWMWATVISIGCLMVAWALCKFYLNKELRAAQTQKETPSV